MKKSLWLLPLLLSSLTAPANAQGMIERMVLNKAKEKITQTTQSIIGVLQTEIQCVQAAQSPDVIKQCRSTSEAQIQAIKQQAQNSGI